MATAIDPEGWLGPVFRVFEATRWLGPFARGYIVQHRETGLFIWTGGNMSAADAAQRLLDSPCG